MSSANYSISFSTNLDAAAASVNAGDCLTANATNTGYLVGNTANKGANGRCSCVALTAATAPGAVSTQAEGQVDASITGLAPLVGPEQFVRVSTTGRLERIVSPALTDEVVGKADQFGNVRLSFAGVSFITPTPVSAVAYTLSGASVALTAGDAFCVLPGSVGVVTKATSAAVTAAGGAEGVVGVASVGWNPGDTLVFTPYIAAAATGLGAGVACKVGLSSTGRLLRATSASVTSGSRWIGQADTLGNVFVVPRRAYSLDPRDFGCPWNGSNDDLPCWKLMMLAISVSGDRIDLPDTGLGWFSDDVPVNRTVHLSGRGGGNGQSISGFHLAPGKKLYLQAGTTSVDGQTSQLCTVERCDVLGSILIRGAGFGGSGINNFFSAAAFVRAGDCYIRSTGSTQRFFRAGNEGNFGASEPPWVDTPGNVLVDNGITWTTECFPQLLTLGASFVVGQRIFIPNDNRYYFECTAPGTTGATAIAAGFLTPAIGGTVTDGASFVCKLAPGVQMDAPNVVLEKLYITKVTGAGVHAQAGLTANVAGVTNADNFRMKEVITFNVGLGVFTAGDDVNGWTIDNLYTFYCGWALSIAQGFTPSVSLFGSEGGHAIHEHSLGGGTIKDLYCQTSTGRPILKDSTGTVTALGCFSELTYPCKFAATGAAVMILGGDILGELAKNVNITSSTNATPIVITSAAHGLSTGSTVTVAGHLVNTNANGTWVISVLSANTFALNGSITTGSAGGATGAASMLNDNFIMLSGAGASGLQSIDATGLDNAGSAITIRANLGANDGKTAFSWLSSKDSGAAETLCISDTLTGWPNGWWVTTHNRSQVLATHAEPTPRAAWPSGATARPLGSWPFWAPKGVMVGEYTSDPQVYDNGTAAPSGGTVYFTRGSVRWNTVQTVGAPTGWAAVAAGSPGTWEELPLLGGAGFFAQDMANADQTVSAANSSKGMFTATGIALTADRTLTLTCAPNGKMKIIRNSTAAGAFGVLVKFSSGTATTAIAVGAAAVVYGDGTNAQILLTGA